MNNKKTTKKYQGLENTTAKKEKEMKKNYKNVGVEVPNDRKNKKQFELTLKDPWFTLVKSGLKKVEGRVNYGVVADIRKGDVVVFTHKVKNGNNVKEEKLPVKITKVMKYPTFNELLFEEKLYKVLPGFPTIKCGKMLYEQYYKYGTIKNFGVVALHFE